MTIRTYISEFIAVGNKDGRDIQTSVVKNIVNDAKVLMLDGGSSNVNLSRSVLCRSDLKAAQHQILNSDIRVRYLPFEEAGTGRPLGLDESTNLMAQIDIDRVVSRCEAVGIPLHDFAGKTVKQVFRRIVRRLILRAFLGPDDFVEGLDTTWGTLSSARRTLIRDRLREIGVDMTVVNGPDTIRVVQQKILDQDISYFDVKI